MEAGDIVKVDKLSRKYKLFIVLAIWCILIVRFNVVNAQQPTLKNGLSTFVKSHLIYPSYSAQNCIQGKVNVGFKLNLKGEVTFSKVTKGVIGDLDQEALRVIRMSSKKWQVPMTHDTTALIIAPINFALDSRDCLGKNDADIRLAINEYEKDEQLQKVVYNYYEHKEKGLSNDKTELAILKIKDDLGIDEDCLREKLNTAQLKIKQGDLQGACEDLKFIKYMGSTLADKLLAKYCK